MGSEPSTAYLPVLYILVYLLLGTSTANVLLIGNNVSLSFDDLEANFAPAVKGSGECGILYAAEPLDACLPLTNKVVEGANSPVALIIRGRCNFEDKVRRAQNAGFKAAIVYDNVDGSDLVPMAGTSAGIKIHAVFVSKASGEELKKYVGLPNMELWIIPTFENSAWSIIAISFISLLAMSAVLATCFFVRRHRIRRERPRTTTYVREFHGMSGQLVSALPSLIFTSALEDNCTSRTCAICLEDYAVGDKLRVLPCRHKFHAFCVDSWLTIWRTFCPMCKSDVRTSSGCPPASEHTPLLSPALTSVAISTSSSHPSQLPSSLSSVSSAIRISLPWGSSRSPDPSCTHSLSGTPYMQHSFRSYRNSPALSLSRSSVDLRNASSHISRASYLATPNSLDHPLLFSPLDPRYASQYIPSSSNASSHLAGSSSRLACPLHCSESAASFSPFASAQSLPGC